MSSPAAVVRSFFEAMEARDWDRAAELVAPDATIEFTETGERFVGDDFVAMNRAYPGGWHIEVVEVLAHDDRVAAQVRVEQGAETFWCAGFYRVAGGRIAGGTEHWVTAGSVDPPAWRLPFTRPA